MQKNMINGYTIKRMLGKGGTGSVFQATRKGVSYALKRIQISEEVTEEMIINQAKNMIKAQCEDIVQVRQYIIDEKCCWIVMELCDTSLAEIFKHLKLGYKTKICYEVIRAMSSIHQRNIWHRDLRLQNVLVKFDMEKNPEKIKLSDFGQSRQISYEKNIVSQVGNAYYRAPQLLIGNSYDSRIDSWALGLLILEVWSNRRICDFQNGGIPAVIENFPKQSQFNVIKDPKLRRIAGQLLVKNPENRKFIKDIWKTWSQQEEQLKIIILKAAEVENWNTLLSTQTLDLSKKQINSLPYSLGNLKNLSELDLTNNSIEQLPLTIGLLKNLTKLTLTKNKLKDIPQCISQLEKLNRLYLSGNQISIMSVQIFNLPLVQLQIESNKIGSIPMQIGRLGLLENFSIGDNPVGELPREIGKLKKLKQLWMHQTRLTILPEEIGQLTNLIQFKISNNRLQHLPDSFCKLSQLKRLWIFNNNLSKLLTSLKQLSIKYDKKITEQQASQFGKLCERKGTRLKWSTWNS